MLWLALYSWCKTELTWDFFFPFLPRNNLQMHPILNGSCTGPVLNQEHKVPDLKNVFKLRSNFFCSDEQFKHLKFTQVMQTLGWACWTNQNVAFRHWFWANHRKYISSWQENILIWNLLVSKVECLFGNRRRFCCLICHLLLRVLVWRVHQSNLVVRLINTCTKKIANHY